MMYYREVVRLALAHAPDARSVIDVGSMNSPFILRFDWIPEKASLDLYKQGRLRRVKNIRADFLTWQPDRMYDLVLCLQVLEHLDKPAPFARKLLACGRRVIVTVPYRWPPGHEPSHVQDPVDEAKLAAWLGRPWIEHLIAREADDPFARLIVVVDGTADLAATVPESVRRAASDEAPALSARLLRAIRRRPGPGGGAAAEWEALPGFGDHHGDPRPPPRERRDHGSVRRHARVQPVQLLPDDPARPVGPVSVASHRGAPCPVQPGLVPDPERWSHHLVDTGLGPRPAGTPDVPWGSCCTTSRRTVSGRTRRRRLARFPARRQPHPYKLS
jgi:hypothetical protein